MLDDIIGVIGWRLLAWSLPDPFTAAGKSLCVKAQQVVTTLSIRTYTLTPETDVTGEYATWFTDVIKGNVVLVRPDFYVATAGKVEELEDLLEEMHGLLSLV